jgi:glycosyltransferase involved in cell wall biosynthesis
MKKVIYYLPVPEEYISRWEYYQVDLEMLKDSHTNVIVCNSFREVLKHIFSANLVYCWWWHRSAHIVLLARLFNVKTYVTGAIHMYDISGSSDYYRKSFFYRLFSKISLRFSHRNLFISKDQFQQVTSHIKTKNPTLLMSSLKKDENFLDNIQKSKQYISFKNYKFITVCWHTTEQYKRKGVLETLDALALLKKRSSINFEWVILGGSGDGISLLKSRIKSLSLDENISLILDATEQEKNNYFLISDLYIQPSWHEGFGNASLEAMSFGLPALVSRYTAQPELVGSTGIIVHELSGQIIYENLVDFMNLDLKTREKNIDNIAKRISDNFSYEVRLKNYKNILDLDIE